ncbi:MAG TPA: cupin domain-containing protein, partial [Longimicrobiales bacterium]|nr:cupin domain-containing protein [Longimicrobiales bacterium]
RVNIANKFAQFAEQFSPKLVATVNDTAVKLVKVQGEFVWHHHDVEDELFLVIKGRLLMQFRDREEWVEEGEFIVVPHGVEHRPVAPDEAHIMLIEPASTLNTGNVVNERTVRTIEAI